MNYEARHPQPFSYAEAMQFEIATITKGTAGKVCRPVIISPCDVVEITRLQNSLEHLDRTQLQLREFMIEAVEKDRELVVAYEENELVMWVSEITLLTVE